MKITLPLVYAKFDETLAKLLAQDGAAPPCGPGCSACCSEPVLAGRQEAELIVARLRDFPLAEQERIVAAVEDRVARFLASPLRHDSDPSAHAYRKLRLPCPLLTPEGRCGVYEIRPLACRAHVARAHPERCHDDRLR